MGGHAKAACLSCHVGERYKDLPQTCSHCHGLQDVHENRFGTACESCHTDDNWKSKSFDHGKFTKFELTGAHNTAACSDCHGEKSPRHCQRAVLTVTEAGRAQGATGPEAVKIAMARLRGARM